MEEKIKQKNKSKECINLSPVNKMKATKPYKTTREMILEYLTNVKDKATAKEISDYYGIIKDDVYNVMSDLVYKFHEVDRDISGRLYIYWIRKK